MFKKIKSLTIALIGVLFMLTSQPAVAQPEQTQDIGIVTPQAYQYIWDASCMYSKNGTSIGVLGTTQTYTTVNKITTTVYLDQKISSGWSNVTSWTNIDYDTDICEAYGSYTGTSGNTYRVRCYHRVDNGTIESNTSYTSSFTVS